MPNRRATDGLTSQTVAGYALIAAAIGGYFILILAHELTHVTGGITLVLGIAGGVLVQHIPLPGAIRAWRRTEPPPKP